MAFRKVWKNRRQLQGLFNPLNEDPFHGTITVQVDVTTYARIESSLQNTSNSKNNDVEMEISRAEPPKTGGFDPYTVNVEVGRDQQQQGKPSAPDLFKVRTLTRNAALSETNPEAWLYARVAFLFFCALLISWVPSSANRLHALANPSTYSFGLNYTESLVLPLQGFWNALVYMITSQTACRNLWRSATGAQELPRKSDAALVSDRVVGLGGDPGAGVKGPETKSERFAGGLACRKGDTKLERFTSRMASQRLEGDDSSITILRGN